jgi:hypothetical protein
MKVKFAVGIHTLGGTSPRHPGRRGRGSWSQVVVKTAFDFGGHPPRGDGPDRVGNWPGGSWGRVLQRGLRGPVCAFTALGLPRESTHLRQGLSTRELRQIPQAPSPVRDRADWTCKPRPLVAGRFSWLFERGGSHRAPKNRCRSGHLTTSTRSHLPSRQIVPRRRDSVCDLRHKASAAD